MLKTMLSVPANTCHQGNCVTVHYVERVVALLFHSVRRQLACGQLWGVCQFWVFCSNNSKIQLDESTVMYIFHWTTDGGIKGWYWPQELLSMPTDNIHKSWEAPSDKTSVSSASKSDFLTSSIVIPGQCNFSCSREERMKASPQCLRTETFG